MTSETNAVTCPSSAKVTILIPAFDEAQSIGLVIAQLHACADCIHEIIVVDDGSHDNTAEIAQAAGARVVRHPQNRGYGASLKTGIRHATTEWILTIDADGQHRVEDARRLCEIGLGGPYDMVVGQRTALLHSPFWRMPGKRLLGIMANHLTQRKIPDLNCGLRLIRRDVAMRYLHLCPSGFSFSTTITMALHARGYNVGYVPIQVNKRMGRSTVSLSTGLDTVILIMRIAALFNPLRVFLPISFLLGFVGIAWAIPFAWAGHGLSVGALLAIVTAVLLFGLGLLCDQISQLRLERFE